MISDNADELEEIVWRVDGKIKAILRGGMASANALATGREAITFNAAALSPKTKDNLSLNKNAKITAYVVEGEIVHYLQSSVYGLRAEATTFITYPRDNYWLEGIPGAELNGIAIYQRGLSHLMFTVFECIDTGQKIIEGEW